MDEPESPGGAAGWAVDLLVRGGRLVDPARGIDAVQDVLIRRGRVAALGAALQAAADTPVLEATGLVVTPGFIDVHVHLREPGFEAKETIATGTQAAAAGGICAVACMPNTDPPPDSAVRLRQLRERIRASAQVRVYPIGCITRGRRGATLAPLAELAAAGAVAFSDDGDPVADARLMEEALRQAHRLGRPLTPHEEVRSLTAGGCMHEGLVAARMGVKGMPVAAEEEMVRRDLELARRTGGPLHIAHISTAAALRRVRQARSEGLAVTCEVMTHHFSATDEEVERHGANAKMSPPLRSQADVEAMRQGLADGTIDVIATDHAPHTAVEKSLPLAEAPFGIVGLETAVGLTLTSLVHAGVLDLAAAVARWTSAPARIFGLPGGRLAVGDPGDVTVLDPGREWVVDPAAFRSKGRNTPFAGRLLRGRAVATVVGGRVVFAGL
ncbi:MAG: dihydroorotase [Candidatus Latescibacterota bacterium]